MFKFSPSTITNTTKKAKKLAKSTGIKLREARDRVAQEYGFKSFPDLNRKHIAWEKLPTVYIYLSRYTSIRHSQEVYDKLDTDEYDVEIKDILGNEYNDAYRERVNDEESFSTYYQVFNFHIDKIDNHKLGITQVSNEERDIFFETFNNKNIYGHDRIDLNEGYLFKFIHFRFDPTIRTKIEKKHEESSKKYNYKVFKEDITREITEYLDKELQKITTIKTYTEDKYIEEEFDISDHSFIVDGEYFNGVGLYDSIEDDFSGRDYY